MNNNFGSIGPKTCGVPDGIVDLADYSNVANTLGSMSQDASPLTERGPSSDLAVMVTPTVVAAYDSTTFDPVPVPDPMQVGTHHQGVTLQVDFEVFSPRTSLSDPQFGNVAFSVGLGPGVAVNPLIPTWTPNNPTTDNGIEPGGPVPLFDANADLGSEEDLQWIVVGLRPGIGPSDPRVAMVQDQPALAGFLFVEWDGVAPSYLDVEMLGISEIDANGDLVEVDGAMAGGALSFGGGEPPLTGDYNSDGVVDAADYTVMRDGVEPIGDRVYAYLRWEENFGAGRTSPASIPEPAAAAALTTAAVVASFRRQQ